MQLVRKSEERGGGNFGWLKTAHSFSFSDYYDPQWMGFRSLRVINEDYVAAAEGFPTHPHRDMEIITYIVSGRLKHADSMGTSSVIGPGEVQRITAGRGITHSEFNPDADRATKLLQIWIIPRERGLTPSYDQRYFGPEEKRDQLRLIVSPDGRDESISISQDASMYASILSEGASLSHSFGPGRHGWLQIVSGLVEANGETLAAGDALALSEAPELNIRAQRESEFLLFDLG
jgi:redox-sensitive bicupin YhaK (pirin superfamily)